MTAGRVRMVTGVPPVIGGIGVPGDMMDILPFAD